MTYKALTVAEITALVKKEDARKIINAGIKHWSSLGVENLPQMFGEEVGEFNGMSLGSVTKMSVFLHQYECIQEKRRLREIEAQAALVVSIETLPKAVESVPSSSNEFVKVDDSEDEMVVAVVVEEKRDETVISVDEFYGMLQTFQSSPSQGFINLFVDMCVSLNAGLGKGFHYGVQPIDDALRARGVYGTVRIGGSMTNRYCVCSGDKCSCLQPPQVIFGCGLPEGYYVTGHACEFVVASRHITWSLIVPCRDFFPVRERIPVDPRFWGKYQSYAIGEGGESGLVSMTLAEGFSGVERVTDGELIVCNMLNVTREPGRRYFDTRIMCELDTPEFYERCQLLGSVTSGELKAMGSLKLVLYASPDKEFHPVQGRWYYARNLYELKNVALRARLSIQKICSGLLAFRFDAVGPYAIMVDRIERDVSVFVYRGVVGRHRNVAYYETESEEGYF